MKEDAALVQAVLTNGPEALGPIIKRYKDAVFGVALARLRNFHDAEDITQAVFIEAFERLGRLKDPSRLGAWLRSIAIHRCIDHLRRQARVTGPQPADELADHSKNPQADVERQELRDRVMAAIGRLSKVQRETVALFYINGYSQQEVAAIQEVPLGTVKYRLHEARNNLKKDMMDMVEDVLKDGAPKPDLGERVFELLSRHASVPYPELFVELRKIGSQGFEGFVKALESPHWLIRRRATGLLDVCQAPQNQEIIIELSKKALHDTNKIVRRFALETLLDVTDVPEERKRREFVPLVVPLLFDRSKRVRRHAAWQLARRPEFVPLDQAARALLREKDRVTRAWMESLMRRVLNSQYPSD